MLHQVPTQWEVVDAYAVEPVRVYFEDDGEIVSLAYHSRNSLVYLIGATIVRLGPHEIVGAYTFDMAQPAPVRPLYKKRHSSDNSSSKRGSGAKVDETPGRSTHSATRPESHDPRSAPPAVQAQRMKSPTPMNNSDSSLSSSSNLTRLGSSLSFFRNHTQTHPRYDQHRRSDSPLSSGDGSLSTSDSGSSDGESPAPPRHSRRRYSDRSSKSSECRSSTTAAGTAKRAAAAEAPAYRKEDLKRALMFARGELMKQVSASGKNALVLEGSV